MIRTRILTTTLAITTICCRRASQREHLLHAFRILGNDTDSSHRLDGIDLDVEKSDKLDNIATLIQRLRTDFGKDFIITLAPVASALKEGRNLSGFDYKTLEQNYGDEIGWYNAQFYSTYGSMSDPKDYDDIVTNCPLDPSRLVAITLSNEGNGTGWVELKKVKSTVRQLLKKYGDSFGGIAAWEYYNSEPDTDEPWTWAAVMGLAMVNYKEVPQAAPSSTGDSPTSSAGGSAGGSPGGSPVGGSTNLCTCTKFNSCGCRMYDQSGPPGYVCTCFS